jgi:drug/metabolite transporter (DMT)-like permease
MDSALLILSECMLSAYPLLIQMVDATLFFQTGLRMIVYTLVAVLAIFATGIPFNPMTLLSGETAAAGLLNLLHVASSYIAFDKLPAGNAMALFYTYPVWNILGSAAVFGETIPMKTIPVILVALVGAILLAKPETSHWNIVGIVSALVAALTETGIYLWFKQKKESSDEPFTKMAQMYGSSGGLWILGTVILLAIGYIGADIFKLSASGLGAILTFNTVLGFIGYALRFYLVPRVPTVIYSALSFFGIVSAYLLGLLFLKEVPTTMQMLGAVAIVFANTILLRKETA